tara:strand:- start:56 stop:1393 length:1338 start_codon:yes stop_codon:yes gene_type:complete
MPKNKESDLLKLNRALQEFQRNAKEIDDVEENIAVKEAGKTVVKFNVMTTDRETSRDRVEKSLKKEFKNLVKRKQRSESSMECTVIEGNDGMKYVFIYKPTKGGMSQTTLNSSITELYPCIAFEKGIKVTSAVSRIELKKFHQQISKACTKDLVGKVFVNDKDFEAGKGFIDNAERGKFEEKIKNAINILRWIQGVNRKHEIIRVCWGYRKKPAGIMSNHPGDIFLQFKNKAWLGVSLKAGGEKTNEPKLNTYVKPIFDYFGKSREYEKIKDKLWPQYMEIPGIKESDKRDWGKNNLALKTYNFEKTSSESEKKYNELYDKNLAIIKDELINLIGKKSNFEKAKEWIKEKVAQQQQDVPLVVVKATQSTARRDKASDLLIEAVSAVKQINAELTDVGGKQAFTVKLIDGTKVKMDFTARTNKVGANHKMGQFTNLAVKFNKVSQI